MADTPAKKPRKSTATLSDIELEALKATKAERSAQRKGAKYDGEAELLATVAEMDESDRTIATRIHAVVKANAPSLAAKTWYGMPAWANAEGKVVCFFQSGAKFKTRYSTFGFQDPACLDDGNMWPVSFAVTRITAAEEARIAALLKQALA